MVENEFLVDSEIDEAEQLIEKWKRMDSDSSEFSITINPTLGCNLRCWYCYESHDNKPIMRNEVLNSICRLIDNKMQTGLLKSLNISFFGGEPLIGFNNIVLPILKHASKKCEENGVRLTTHFTTNGVLLTERVLCQLDEIKLSAPAAFQITLDGNREMA